MAVQLSPTSISKTLLSPPKTTPYPLNSHSFPISLLHPVSANDFLSLWIHLFYWYPTDISYKMKSYNM